MSMNCRFIHIFTVPKKSNKKNQRYRRLRIPEEETEGGHPPSQEARGRGPTACRARRLPGRRSHPLVPPSAYIYTPSQKPLLGTSFRDIPPCSAAAGIPRLG